MTNNVTHATLSVWMIGMTEEDFKASKFPSKKEVLKVLFHYRIEEKLSLEDSIEKTSSLILPIWDKARIPTKAPVHVVEHIRKLHAEWQGLKKRISRSSRKNLKNQQMFQDRLDDLFYIAHRDAMSIIKIEEIGRELLHLACRHHISEIMLEKVFGMQYVSKSPEIELFGHFKNIWHLLDKSSFSTAVEDDNMASIIATWKDSVTEFAIDQLEKRQVRDDYRELLELSVVFLGGTPPRGIRFQNTGAIHRVRFQSHILLEDLAIPQTI